LWVAHWVAGWPGAVAVLPSMPALALAIVGAGFVWLCMGRGRWRWPGAIALVAAIASMWIAQRPDVLISPSGKLVAFRSPGGALVLSSNRAERLVRETWLRRNGQIGFQDIGNLDGSESWLRCDGGACDYAGRVRVFLNPSAGCTGLELTVIPRAVADECAGAEHVIDQTDLTARGAHAIYLKDGEIEIIDAASAIGARPWAPPALSSNDEGADQ
jgi:competence protein ComEC